MLTSRLSTGVVILKTMRCASTFDELRVRYSRSGEIARAAITES
jgi:hypothetical protein